VLGHQLLLRADERTVRDMTRTTAADIAAAAAMAAVTACGSGQPAGPPTIASVARQVGCTAPHDYSSEEMFAHETASCTLNGRDVEIATFVSSGEQSSWEQFAKSFGVIIKDGPLWAVAGT
jgi:hypothetical protein